MRFLLDTQVVLWALADSSRLGKQAREQLKLADEINVSAASIWECEIKAELGRLILPKGYADAITAAGFAELPISCEHAAGVNRVELPHRDPFDRVLMAQAIQEDLVVITADEVLLDAYPERCIDGRI